MKLNKLKKCRGCAEGVHTLHLPKRHNPEIIVVASARPPYVWLRGSSGYTISLLSGMKTLSQIGAALQEVQKPKKKPKSQAKRK